MTLRASRPALDSACRPRFNGLVPRVFGEGGRAKSLPNWLEEVLAAVCEACMNDVKGRMSGFSYRWSKPEDNSWGTWLLMIAPSVIEISGGRDDGGTGFDFVDADLLALPKCLDEVESFDYDPSYGEEPHLTLTGTKGGRSWSRSTSRPSRTTNPAPCST